MTPLGLALAYACGIAGGTAALVLPALCQWIAAKNAQRKLERAATSPDELAADVARMVASVTFEPDAQSIQAYITYAKTAPNMQARWYWHVAAVLPSDVEIIGASGEVSPHARGQIAEMAGWADCAAHAQAHTLDIISSLKEITAL